MWKKKGHQLFGMAEKLLSGRLCTQRQMNEKGKLLKIKRSVKASVMLPGLTGRLTYTVGQTTPVHILSSKNTQMPHGSTGTKIQHHHRLDKAFSFNNFKNHTKSLQRLLNYATELFR